MTIIITTGVLMSKKRGMSKQQRLYYEHQNKEKIRRELAEFAKQEKEFYKTDIHKPYNPYESSYFT
jgi:hypothetical protein